MARFTFPAGNVISLASVGDGGSGWDSILSVAVGVTATVTSDAAGSTAVQTYNTNGMNAQVTVNSQGWFSPFQVDDHPVVYLRFGDLVAMPHYSVEQMNALSEATAARNDASAAVQAAQEAQARAQEAADLVLQRDAGASSGTRFWSDSAQAWYWYDSAGVARLGRPPVPAGVAVEAYSKLYPNATPPPGALRDDVWFPHISRLSGA